MELRTILVVNNDLARKHYEAAIRKAGALLTTVTSLDELHEAMSQRPYHGVFVDVPTKIMASKEEKIHDYEIWQLFPVCLLKWFSNTSEIRVKVHQHDDAQPSIEFFLRQFCQAFIPKLLRRKTRVPLHFNVLLSHEKHYFPDRVDKTFTLNVSRHGFFICTNRPWKLGDEVWFVVKELKDGLPISGIVKWGVPWGQSMKVPGFGIRLNEIVPEQMNHLRDLILEKIPDILF